MEKLGINFTAWPEMLAWPYLMLQGWLPYRDIAIAHSPLLLVDLAIFYKIFGVGILQLKIYTWIWILINTGLTYFVSKKYWNKSVALLSSFLYLILCVVYEGNGLWFDLALTPFALLLYFFIKEKKYFVSGIIFALGILTKQTFVWFLIPIVFLTFNVSKYNFFKKFISGGLVVGVIFSLVLFALGIFDDFYYWAIKFGVFYLPSAQGQISLPSLKQFIFAAFPLVVLFLNPSLVLWILAGIMGVYPRWGLFHFQPALPFLAITISTLLVKKTSKIIKILTITLLVMFLAIGIKRQVGQSTRFFEPEVEKVVELVKDKNVNEIYVINYWDNIYALTNTFPATKPLIPYIPWYLSYESNSNQILSDLKIKMPEVVVIGERDDIFPDLYLHIDKFYSCNLLFKNVELCEKN